MQVVDYTDYLEAGWRIFPLHGIVRTAEGLFCGCGDPDCKAVGKHPKAASWQHTPQWDELQLRCLEDHDDEFSGNQLIDGFGCVTTTSLLLVVDVDARNGGVESAKRLQKIRDQCGYIVATGSGNGSEHWYFIVPAGLPLMTSVKGYGGIDFKSSGYVVGCGSEHVSGDRYSALVGSPKTIAAAPPELLSLLERPAYIRAVEDGRAVDYTMEQLRSMVLAIPNSARDYERWIRVGMGIHSASGGSAEGEHLWVSWTRHCGHDEGEEIGIKWHSFGKSANPVTVGTLITLAKDAGWREPVEFSDNTEWDVDLDIVENKIDLLKPQGLVGELANWINSRAYYPREHLAVAAALQIVSNLAGMNYVVEGMRTTLNLVVLGIAGSRTGKQNIIDRIGDCHRITCTAHAKHGGIKSEQEIIRNAVRNQASFYVVDEVGSFLAKLGNSRKTGRTAYLEAVPATIMSMYSAAGSTFDVTGDMKMEMLERIDKEISREQKKIDAGGKGDIQPLLEERTRAKTGIVSPYLSFFGVSEPHSFNEAVNGDKWILTGGFMGRALIFEEMETVPDERPIEDISDSPLPISLAARLNNLYADGSTVDPEGRVERKSADVQMIVYTPEAKALLKTLRSYWTDQAKRERDEGSGLQSLALGAAELTIKVAGTLCADTKVITPERLEWAHALVKDSVNQKIIRAKIVEGSESTDIEERSEALLQAIVSTLSNSAKPLAVGVIANRHRNVYTKGQIQEGIDHLVGKGVIGDKEEKKNNGVKYKYYFTRHL